MKPTKKSKFATQKSRKRYQQTQKYPRCVMEISTTANYIDERKESDNDDEI